VDVSGSDRPDWVQANPEKIEASLQRALVKPSGGWFVVGASRSFRKIGPFRAEINDTELVLWRAHDRSELRAAPAACPHMGAHLGGGNIVRGQIICPWHGLALGGGDGTRSHGSWSPLPVHDDGVLLWVQMNPSGPGALPTPIIGPRPERFFDGVIRRDAVCEPQDVIANRLDPWHGAHFHPYAFSRLRVTDETDDFIDMVVAYKAGPRFEVEVAARFATPDPRTIVMTIVDGEGTGSVVETHATPVVTATLNRPPRTAIIEATLATSDRPGFISALKGASIARPIVRFAANRLWKDDAAYAERRYSLRTKISGN
jgi:phenylpropionate dioxygenase-like ring-hydroxylating dioxygenase large terminal subunit